MLLPLPFNHWMLSTKVPFDSLHKTAITLTTVSYMRRLHGHLWHLKGISIPLSSFIRPLLSKLPKYLMFLAEFRANNHDSRSQDRWASEVPHITSELGKTSSTKHLNTGISCNTA